MRRRCFSFPSSPSLAPPLPMDSSPLAASGLPSNLYRSRIVLFFPRRLRFFPPPLFPSFDSLCNHLTETFATELRVSRLNARRAFKRRRGGERCCAVARLTQEAERLWIIQPGLPTVPFLPYGIVLSRQDGGRVHGRAWASYVGWEPRGGGGAHENDG